MPPISVLWLTKGLGPGGTERLLVAAADAHDRQVRQAVVRVRAATQGPPRRRVGGARSAVHVPRRRHLLDLAMAAALTARDGGFDIVHVHAPMPGSVARVVARTLPSSKRPAFVTTEHNTVSTYRLPVRWANSITSRWDAATITVSDEAMQSLAGDHALRPIAAARHRRRVDIGPTRAPSDMA